MPTWTEPPTSSRVSMSRLRSDSSRWVPWKRRPPVLRDVVVAVLGCDLPQDLQAGRARAVRRAVRLGVLRAPRLEVDVEVGGGPGEVGAVGPVIGPGVEDRHTPGAAALDEALGRSDRAVALDRRAVALEHVEEHEAGAAWVQLRHGSVLQFRDGRPRRGPGPARCRVGRFGCRVGPQSTGVAPASSSSYLASHSAELSSTASMSTGMSSSSLSALSPSVMAAQRPSSVSTCWPSSSSQSVKSRALAGFWAVRMRPTPLGRAIAGSTKGRYSTGAPPALAFSTM